MKTYSTAEGLIEIVKESIVKPESKLTKEVADFRGMSTPKIRHFLNNLCSYGPCKYLEIGVYSGSTLIPTVFRNDVEAIGIDNWSQFIYKVWDDYDAKTDLKNRLERYSPDIKDLKLIDLNCFDEQCVKQVEGANIYFYDGQHDAEATDRAIRVYGKRCAQPFVLIVDDLDTTPEVWEGINMATPHFNVHGTWVLSKEQGYHMGIFVAVLEAQK